MNNQIINTQNTDKHIFELQEKIKQNDERIKKEKRNLNTTKTIAKTIYTILILSALLCLFYCFLNGNTDISISGCM